MKTIWYGVKDNDVRFANNQNTLASNGVSNPQSFTTSGDISGLTFIDDEQQGATAQQGQTAQG